MSLSTLSSLQTEARNSHTLNIDTVSSRDLCRIIHAQDTLVAPAVANCLSSIAAAIDAITERIRSGGRMISFGAGTSGRLGVLDASELPPTFHAPPSQFMALIAGGDSALRSSVEGAEDSAELGAKDFLLQSPTMKDIALGITASGRTPYVLGALNKGREKGCFTIGIASTSPSEMGSAQAENGGKLCDIIIECVTGAEVVTGSTRLKAGSATKMILNMITTSVMIKLGKTYGNLMVDLQTSNAKLQTRARNIVRSLCPDGIHTPSGVIISTPSAGSTESEKLAWDAGVDALLKSANGSVKLAILAGRLGCGMVEGKQRLEDAGGVLSVALGEQRKDLHFGTSQVMSSERDNPSLVLCIDGGGTKTAAVISERDGILARGQAGTSNFTAVGLNATIEAIKEATINALAAIPAFRYSTTSFVLPSLKPVFTKVWIGIAGADRPPEAAVLLPALEEIFLLSEVDGSMRLTNDGFLLTSPIQNNQNTREGIIVIAGTGSIAISYRKEDGENGRLVQIRRSGGWGHLLGDEGSAFMTGRSAIRSVLTAMNVREQLRPWHREILDHFGAPSEHQLISCVTSMPSNGKDAHDAENARKLRIAACANIVLRAFEIGEPSAQEVVRGTAREIIELIKPLIKSVLHPEGVIPANSTLCLGGGLMIQECFSQLLMEEMTATEAWKWNKVELVKEAAVAGASLLAREI